MTILSPGQSLPEEIDLGRRPQSSTRPSSKRPKKLPEPEPGERKMIHTNNTIVQSPGQPPHREKDLGRNAQPLTELLNGLPESVQPPPVERNGPGNTHFRRKCKVFQQRAKPEVVRQETRSAGLPQSEFGLPRVS